MLILARKKGERIYVGDRIVIEVVDIRDCHVRIGIEAPKDVEVHREEIYDLVQAERAREGNGDEASGDPLPGSPWSGRIAEAKRTWIRQIRINRRLQKGNRK